LALKAGTLPLGLASGGTVNPEVASHLVSAPAANSTYSGVCHYAVFPSTS
jgi:hypothetical protein